MRKKIAIAQFACVFAFLLSGFRVPEPRQNAVAAVQADVCIYGATAAGVIAAYIAKKMGKSVVLIEPGGRPSLTANGIGHNGGPAVTGAPAAELVELGRQNVLSPAPAVVTLTPAAPQAPRRTPRQNSR